MDSFTDTPFRGNPAAVCLVESELPDDAMLRIAQELNLSETAFVRALEQPGRFGIRFFSPKQEIALCGHATLASARVAHDRLGHVESHFINIEGLDLATHTTAYRVGMSFPAYTTVPAVAPPALLAALGLTAIRNAAHNAETRILLLEGRLSS